MLILTRKVKTSIRIGDDVVIHVIQTGRSTVRLGIEAPTHVRIVRGELASLPSQYDFDCSHDQALLLQH